MRNAELTTHLEIVSAERDIFSGPVKMVVVTGELGEIGVIPGHAPLLTSLRPGQVRITLPNDADEFYYVSGGLLEVQPYTVTVLADAVKRAEEIDEAAAMAAKARAEEAIANKDTDIDYSVAAAELARATAEIRALRKLRKSLK